MDMTIDQQVALDEALVPHASRLRIGKSNFRLRSDITSKESTLQVVYDVLRLTSFYKAFLVTADVPEIYMQEFWATATVHHHSICFKMNNKKRIVNLEYFREMLHICPRIPNQTFDELSFEEEILAFMRNLGHNLPKDVCRDLEASLEDRVDLFSLDLGSLEESASLHVLLLFIPRGSGDGVGKLSKVLDEQEQEDTSTTKGTDTLSGVPDVPKYESESDMESWGDNEEEGDDDDDGNNDDEGGNNDEGDDVAKSNDEQTEFENDDDCSDEEEDVEESDHTQSDEEKSRNYLQHAFQEEEDAHVTLTHVHDATKADDPLQSSSISFDFTSKFLNLENLAPTDTEIASLMKTSDFQDTIPPTPPTLFIPVTQQQQTPTLPTTTSTTIPELPDFAFVFSLIRGCIVDKYLAFKKKEAVDVAVQLQTNKLREEAQVKNEDFLNQVDTTMKSIIKDQVKAQVSKIMPKILIDKMEANKLIEISDTQRTLYNTLVTSYNSENDIISSYGNVVLLKRGHDDKDKDQDPFARSDRGMKRRRTCKDADSSKDPRSKEKRSTRSSKEASKSRHTSFGKSIHSEEPSYNVEDTSKHQDQEYVMGKQMNNPMTGRLLKPTGSRNLKDLPLLIMTRVRDVRSTSDHLRLGLAKLLELKNLLLHTMSSMPLHSTSLHLS
nr:hypothetical protein [Tanacetum cinerariifolium]